MNLRPTLIFIFAATIFTTRSSAQSGIWTWMHGSNTPASAGSYGTKGVAAASNEPPCRYQPCYWTDKMGNFWLFGGVMSGGAGLGNDLWKYDVTTNMWTWMSGPNVTSAPNAAGVAGTKGVPSTNNYPSSRGYGSNCWTDNNGDLWLYGGYGGYNDLWRYRIATNDWTWVNGNQVTTPPSYGTKGVPAASNTPGDKQEVKSAWVDGSNNLVMFGGQDASGGVTSAIWSYDISADKWTWITGTNTTTTGNYGTFRVEAATNEPPSRWSYTRWRDANGNLYIFAGGGASSGYLNDVWRYRPSTNQWTWVNGSNVGGDPGKYPTTKCQFLDGYYPQNRYENQTAFSTSSTAVGSCAKAFWTFGGFANNGILNDLWIFETDSFKFSFVSGSSTPDQVGTYGTLGVRSSTNMVPSKGGQCMWIDNNNNLWLFGGFGKGYALTNDLWRFEPDPTCVDMRLFTGTKVTLPDTDICAGATSTMDIGPHIAVSYSPSTGVGYNVDTSKLFFKPLVTTQYQVIVVGGGCNSTTSDTFNFTVKVTPLDTIKLSMPHPLYLCVGDSSRMPVNPAWSINVVPNTEVKYQAVGGNEIVFYPSDTTNYVVYASVTNKCTKAIDSVKFTLYNDGFTQHLAPMTDTIVCKGDSATYVAVARLKYWNVFPRTYYNVNPDSTVYNFYPPVTTTYQFVGVQQTGCFPHDTVNFTIHRSRLKAEFDLAPKETDLTEPTFVMRNNSIASNGQDWYQNGSLITSSLNATVTATDTGLYCFTLVAKDELNCTDTAEECGKVIDPHIFIPSAFSPNGDGKNDIFGAWSKDVKSVELAVYNRFGERVFISYDKNVGWDGTYQGKRCDVGNYFYYMKYRILDRAPIFVKGDVTLIR